MSVLPTITVSRQGDEHVCNPTETEVRPGDTVAWAGQEPFLVFFPDDNTPFVEGRGPFINGETVTVKGTFPAGDPWKPQFQVGGVFLKRSKGDIKPAGH